ncbi:hypothetical protein A9P82_08050 [Arachidicoccus ginsenosidimutans]|uniref:hypothetical protein n=1 Tax=Arachidicoccus sp. BS20 TaxID=1850526 RepID=UPI0007F07C36|nr:hypothetical protein [Arachidicoccus sp. BS20]ANI89247.1 hypothetical protein A9P82_08050 [Arachidicoccus sp. BS20]
MKKENRKNDVCTSAIPPDLKFVKIYFSQKGLPEAMAITFYNHYKSKKWKTQRGCPVKNWMTAANQWIWNNRPNKPLTLAIKLNIQFPDNIPLFYHGD